MFFSARLIVSVRKVNWLAVLNIRALLGGVIGVRLLSPFALRVPFGQSVALRSSLASLFPPVRSLPQPSSL